MSRTTYDKLARMHLRLTQMPRTVGHSTVKCPEKSQEEHLVGIFFSRQVLANWTVRGTFVNVPTGTPSQPVLSITLYPYHNAMLPDFADMPEMGTGVFSSLKSFSRQPKRHPASPFTPRLQQKAHRLCDELVHHGRNLDHVLAELHQVLQAGSAAALPQAHNRLLLCCRGKPPHPAQPDPVW